MTAGRRRELIERGLRPSWGEESCGAATELSSAEEGKSSRPISWKFPNLHQQFQLFSKFGESGSDGRQITLTQSDKWLRQAKVIEGWNVTTTDTAIAFRKISRGAIWLDYNQWREFLQELAGRKGIDMQTVRVDA
jgi:hypothetical protein